MRNAISSKYEMLFILILVVVCLNPSCVSKKKFVEMTRQRTIAEKRANALHEENTILTSDFEKYKSESENELHLKQRLIDSLRTNINSLTTDIISEKDNIEDQTFNFQLETDRLSQLVGEKDKEIRNLTREINTLKIQVDDLNRELDNAKSGFKFPFGNVKQLERKIQAKDKEIVSLDSSLNGAKQEIMFLNEKIDSQAILIQKLYLSIDTLIQVPLEEE